MSHIRKRTASEDSDVRRLAAHVLQLEQRLEALEAEVGPCSRARKCPCCQKPGLQVIGVRPHPEFGAEGIQQHEVSCAKCGHSDVRLYDPNNYLR